MKKKIPELKDVPIKRQTKLVQARVPIEDVDLLAKNGVDIPEFLRICFKRVADTYRK